MHVVERKVSAGDREIFDLDEFLSRPLFAHLAHNSENGPRESPVWFHWDGQAIWIIGGQTFPENLEGDPRCAIGIVDWEPTTGRCQHVGLRGTAEVLPFDTAMARTIFRRYFGPDEKDWDPRFGDVYWRAGLGDRPLHARDGRDSRPVLSSEPLVSGQRMNELR